MMNLYEIDEQIRIAFKDVDSDGFINDDAFERIESLELESDKKILNIAKYIKERESDIEGLKQAEQSISKRRRSLEKSVDNLKEYAAKFLFGKVSDDFIQVSTRKSERVVLSDAFSNGDYLIEKITYSPDKNKIKEDLKNGVVIDGAHIEQVKNLVIK